MIYDGVQLADNVQLLVSGSSSLTLSGAVSDTGSHNINVNSTGTAGSLVFTAANDTPGSMNIYGGTVTYAPGSSNSGGGAYTLYGGNGATLTINSSGNTVAASALTLGTGAAVNLNAGTLALTGNVTAATGQTPAGINFNGGTLRNGNSGSTAISIAAAVPLTIGGGTAVIDTTGGNINSAAAIGGSGSLTVQGGNTLSLAGASTFAGSTTVSAGTLLITSTASIASTSISVSPGATLQLAGTTAALPSNANISNGTGNGAHGNFLLTGTATQTVGVISGASYPVPDSNSVNATAYSGNTIVGDGSTAASLTATQILQNSLTINAGSTVTIAPSGGGSMTAAPATSGAIESNAATADSGSSDAAAGGDPLTAIQAAIASGAISSTTGQVLENRIAAIERLAATDPGLDVSLLESRVLAVLPWSPSLSTDFALATDGGTSSLALDSTSLGAGSTPAAGAAFAFSASFAGSPAAVPEPSSLLLTALAAAGLAIVACRRRYSTNKNTGR